MDIFFQINPSSLPTESFILGYSRIGKAKIGDGDLYCQIFDSLNRIKIKESNINDSLISEVAIIHNIELVTMDEDLKKVHTQYGGIIYDGFAH